MNVVEKVNPVVASVSVPPAEQDVFAENKSKLMTTLCLNFSLIIRQMVNRFTVEERDGDKYVVFKLN